MSLNFLTCSTTTRLKQPPPPMNHGPLQTLPSNISKAFQKVSRLDLSYNHLINVPDDLGNMKYNYLHLENNKLNNLPGNVWGNEHVFLFELDNNNISAISPSISNSKTLTELLISNNSLYEVTPQLLELDIVLFYADGNNLESIPSEIGKATSLQYLRFNNNNNISSIPDEIESLAQLVDFDIRNNAIGALPTTFESLTSLENVFLHNNPICSNGWIDNIASKKIQNLVNQNGAGCKAQCSIYCQNFFKEDQTCDNECNYAACDYDGGACSERR